MHAPNFMQFYKQTPLGSIRPKGVTSKTNEPTSLSLDSLKR